MQLVRVILGCSLALAPSLMNGAVIEFTNRAAWLAAAGAVTNIDFEGIAPPGGSKVFLGPVTFSGVQFSSPTPPGEAVVSSGAAYVNAWGSGDKLQAFIDFDITLPGNVTAVGSDIMITSTFFYGGNGTYTATLSTGDIFTNIFSSGPPTRSFVGFISTSPIASIRLASDPSLTMIDNFAFNTAINTTVPEPASLALMCLGMLGIFGLSNCRFHYVSCFCCIQIPKKRSVIRKEPLSRSMRSRLSKLLTARCELEAEPRP
jgi:PEP-CTERM motif